MFSSLLLLPLLLPAPPADEVSTQLARLEAPRAEERLAAQRWLAVHLERDHYPLVAETARAGGAEARTRLAQALGADDRHLEIAALLASDSEEPVAGVGEAAIGELLARWSSTTRQRPLRRRALPDEWTENWPRPISLDPEEGNLGVVVDRLARLGGGPAPLVLDPLLDPVVRRFVPDRPPARGRLAGPWGPVLSSLVGVRRVSFEVHGYREGDVEGEPRGAVEGRQRRARPWVRVCKRGDEGDATTLDHVLEWVRGSLREYDPEWNAACARSLAALDWPAAIAWLEARWLRDGEEAALAGLLLAAGRGRVAPRFSDPGVTSRLQAAAAAGMEAARPSSIAHASRLARALGRAGPIGARGQSLAEVFLVGWDGASETSRWMRLVILEGHGRAHEGAAQRCRELLAEPCPPFLALQALRTLVRVGAGGGAPPTLVQAEALLRVAARAGEAEELARLLIATGARPDTWPAGGDRQTRLVVVAWAAALGRQEEARAALTTLLDEPPDQLPETAAALRRWRGLGLGSALEQLVAATPLDGPRGQTLRRLALLAHLFPPEREAREVARLRGNGERPPDPGELLELGALVAADGGAGEEAQEALVEALESGVAAAELLPALELAVEVLHRERRDEEDQRFQARLRSAAARTGHPLAERLYGPDWPPLPEPSPRRLELSDRWPTP